MIVAAVFAAMVLIAGTVVTVVVVTSDDEAEAGEIFLEGASSSGTDPFGSLPGPAVAVSTTSSTATTTATTTGGAAAVRAVSGGQRGLYGGTRVGGRCDPEAQISFLASNPSLANAFVSALNRDPTLRWSGGTQVTTAQIGGYIRELTPVTLVSDTRVTNYGYRNGRATPRQAVLQAGTAVMVDRYGVPRIKCNCGNPLTQPQAVRSTPTYTGPPWPGFNPTTVVVVNQTTVQIDVFILVDLENGGFIERTPGATGTDVPPTTTTTTTTTLPPATVPPGVSPPATSPPSGPTYGTGDVRATLTWTGDCDLDLHVIDPSGTEIYYSNPSSPTGGQLDVDDIPGSGETGSHIENVYWPTGGAPSGAYRAYVRNLGGYTNDSCDFDLSVFVGEVYATGVNGYLVDGADSLEVEWSY